MKIRSKNKAPAPKKPVSAPAPVPVVINDTWPFGAPPVPIPSEDNAADSKDDKIKS